MRILRQLIVLCGLSAVLFSACNKDKCINTKKERPILFKTAISPNNPTLTRSERHNNDLLASQIKTGNKKIPYINISVSDMPQALKPKKTRGEIVNNNTFGPLYNGFKVYAYKYPSTETTHGNLLKDVFINGAKTQLNGNTYSFTKGKYYFPGNNYKCQYICFAPKDLSVNVADNSATITVQTPENIDSSNNYDILVANNNDQPGNPKDQVVPLTFNHILSAIKFQTGKKLSKDVTVKSITFSNIYTEGTYDVISNTWTLSKKSNITKEYNFKNSSNNPAGTQIQNKTIAMLVIPQNLNGVTVTIKFQDNVGTYSLSKIINKDIELVSGKEFNMTLSNSSGEWVYYFNVTPKTDQANANNRVVVGAKGNNIKYVVESYKYRRYKPAEKIAVPYSKSVEQDNVQWLGWQGPNKLTDEALVSFGDAVPNSDKTETTENVSVARYNNPDCYTSYMLRNKAQHDKIFEALKNKPNALYNLSTDDGTGAENHIQESSNCYIVSTYGKYVLPLVYGNAIINDQDNKSAYNDGYKGNTGSIYGYDDELLQVFIGYTGANIDTPYILKNNTSDWLTPESPTIIWEDHEGLISNLKFEPYTFKKPGGTDKEYIQGLSFEIKKEDIAEGNAVIGLMNSNGYCVWSWHIWVFDDPNITRTGNKRQQNGNYKFMSYPIGFNRGYLYNPTSDTYGFEVNSFPTKNYVINFVQDESKNENSQQISQDGSDPLIGGPSACYFQWGRKEPMLPRSGRFPDGETWNMTCWAYKYRNGAKNQSGFDHNLTKTNENWDTEYLEKNTNTNEAKDYLAGWTAFPMCFAPNANSFSNLWDKHCDSGTNTYKRTQTIKTIYDPSPRGFAVPPFKAFDGLNDIEGTYSSFNQFATFRGTNTNMTFLLAGYRNTNTKDGKLFDLLENPYPANDHYPSGKYWNASSYYEDKSIGATIMENYGKAKYRSYASDWDEYWAHSTGALVLPYQYPHQ